MDELTVMRSFRAERVKQNPTARAAAWQALEARFDPAQAAGASATPPRPARLFHRRRLLAFAGAAALAAALAGVLVLGSGPTAQPAAAEVLRQTAAVAAAADRPSGNPGPGQFLYAKTKSLELQEWTSGLTASFGGVIPKPKGAFSALVSWQEEVWRSAYESSRHRWVMGTLRFLSSAERSRWEKAGSPLPGPFDGEKGGSPGAHIIDVRRGVRDVEGMDGPGFGDFSKLPTEPKALRLAIEHRQAPGSLDNDGPAKPLNTGQAISELWDILDKPNTTAALRAAVFGALAEEPGIELNRNAKDLVGRSGYALGYESSKSSSYGAQQPGLRVEYIFDPKTSEILGRREVIADPAKLSLTREISAGTVRREVAYLRSGVVDSTHERPDERKRRTGRDN